MKLNVCNSSPKTTLVEKKRKCFLQKEIATFFKRLQKWFFLILVGKNTIFSH